VIGVGVNQNPVKIKKKKKKKKEKKKKLWQSAPSAVKTMPISPALAPRNRSGAAGAAWRGMWM
jgi:hypothetical protein